MKIASLITTIIFALSVSELSFGNQSELELGILSTLGPTSNSSMPSISGVQIIYNFESVKIFSELAKGTYKNSKLFETSSAVANEKIEQDSKLILTIGTKGYFYDWLFWDLGIGINQFSYKTSGTDLSCCVNQDYSRSYDFSGIFIRPSLGFEFSHEAFRFGIRAVSWMHYLSKSATNMKETAAQNSFITNSLNSRDEDGIQSSHMIPPHIYVVVGF